MTMTNDLKIATNILLANLEFLKNECNMDIDEEYVKSYKLKDPKIIKGRLLKLLDCIIINYCDNKNKQSIKRGIDSIYLKDLK